MRKAPAGRGRRSTWGRAAFLTAGSAAVAAGGQVARRRLARGDQVPVVATPPAPAALDAPSLPVLAVASYDGRGGAAEAVSEAYREARRSFNAAREAMDEQAFDRLSEAVTVLWGCAVLAEPSGAAARTMARDTRKLMRLLSDRRDVLAIATVLDGRPAAPAELDGARERLLERVAKLEGRIVDHGKGLFGTKPSRVAGRIALGP